MAGNTLGAPAPASTPTTGERRARLRLVPATTRTRRNHGCSTVGGQLAAVYSARRAGTCYPVTLEIGAAPLQVCGGMTPAQARTLARALVLAADAAELANDGGVQ